MMLAAMMGCQQGDSETSATVGVTPGTATPAMATAPGSPIPSAATTEPATATTTGGSPAQPVVQTATIAPNQEETPQATSPEPAAATSATAPSAEASEAEATAAAAAAAVDGALVAVTMQSEAGVLLNDFPADMRERIAGELIEADDAYWQELAERQVRLATLRLHFRNFDQQEKGQLPLPPAELWQIALDPAGPRRTTIDGHDLVTIAYTFSSTLLADEASLREAEPALATVGGTWQEPFIFPADPDLLLQRTGNACINEGGFPANSYDSENIWRLYDDTCTAESGGVTGCHRLRLPRFDCREAVRLTTGQVSTAVQFERLAWDEALAESVTVGPAASGDTADLMVVAGDLADFRLFYRYVPPGDCGYLEGAVGALGWRRLLTFTATVYNVGGAPLHVGEVSGDPLHNLFQYNACHNHFHYRNYGDFFLGDLTNLNMDSNFSPGDDISASKQAFCVQSTSRYSNSVLAPLTHDYSCRFQGIQTGWVDEYISGLDTQWIDVTDVEVPATGATLQLGFRSNADQFLCEGRPVLDENGEPVWEPTDFTTETGARVSRPLCEFTPGWEENNIGIQEVFVPQTGSFVTQPCRNDEVGPLRNCGFMAQEPADPSCSPEQPGALTLSVGGTGAPQVARICETSAALGGGVACTYNDAIANVVITTSPTIVRFSCPLVRDAETFSGGFSLYTAPVWPPDGHQTITGPVVE